MDITLFGGVSVGDGSIPLNPRDRAVLAVLAMRPGEPVEADRLADAVWGDAPPASWVKNLQGCIVRLRKALGSAAIQTSPQGYRLRVAADEIDAQRFDRLVARGRELLALDQPERAAYLLREALELWQGRPLLELEDWDPGRIEAGRLDELRLEAEELQIDATLQSGHHGEVLARAQAMTDEAPLRERRWELLARAQYQAGHQTDALRSIHRVRRLLVEELGLDPSPGLEELEQAILRQDATLAVEESTVGADAACPYQGLTPYDVDDAEGFFGRDDAVAACLNRLRDVGVLAVVGPSGSGKSSLVRAGVAASLRRDGRRIVVLSPGAHPVDALSAVPKSRAGVALVVDQLEEVFSLCSDPVKRDHFLLALTEQTRTGGLVVSLRADHLGHISAHPDFAKVLEPGLYLLSGMTEEQLRVAIEGPAHQAGLMVEPGLVDLLIREVKDEPGALPLLSHVLRETWLRREGRTLTVSGYQESGGVRRAVAQSAEAVFQSIGTERQGALRDLLLRLVMQGPSGAPVRTPMPRRLVVGDGQQDELVDVLVGSRLVTSDGDVVEIAHEALAQAWPRLRAWLDDDVEGQRLLHHLAQAADAWDSLGRPSSELYRGSRLSRAIEWRDSSSPELTPNERAFLDAAERQTAHEERSAVQRARVQARLIRRLRVVLVGAAVLLVAALVAGGLAVHQTKQAQSNAEVAVQARTESDARRMAAKALTEDDIDSAMLLGVAGVRLDDSPETRSSLFAVLGRHPELTASTQMTGRRVIYLDVSPDGKTVVTYDLANHVRLYDIESGELLGEYQAGNEAQLSWISGQARFSPDGRTLAVVRAAPTRRPIVLLDAESLQPLPAQLGGLSRFRWDFNDMAFSEDGNYFASAARHVIGSRGTTKATTMFALVWDLRSPRRPVTQMELPDGNTAVALSPDGQTLYTTAPLTIHDLSSGRSTPVDERVTVERLMSSPDGRSLVATGSQGATLLDTETGKVMTRLRGLKRAWFARFSGDGRRVAAVSPGRREAAVWDVKTGDPLARLRLDEDGEGVDFGRDSSTVYTAGSDQSLRRWDVDSNSRYVEEIAVNRSSQLKNTEYVDVGPGAHFIAYSSPSGVTFFDAVDASLSETRDKQSLNDTVAGTWHPDGVHYARLAGGAIRIWDASTDDMVNERAGWSDATSLDYSTDGSRLAVAERTGEVSLLDSANLRSVVSPVELDGAVCAVSLGPDNTSAIVLTGTKKVAWDFWYEPCTGWALLDLESARVVAKGDLPTGTGRAVDFSPDGRHAAFSDLAFVVLDLESARPVRTPVESHDFHTLALTYSPDGTRVLSAGVNGSAILWDAETGRALSRVEVPDFLVAAGFGHDARSVTISAWGNGPVYAWDVRVEHAIASACRIAGRDFTLEEWQDNVGDRPFQEICPDQ